MQFYVTVQDFTGVYGQQEFMQSLREDACGHWMDCTGISGTDCYCDDDAKAELIQRMNDALHSLQGTLPGVHFFDNGNYHYMSKLWTDLVQEKFDLVVFDHHPDMQPPRFEGILSCGGWIKEVLDHNPYVQNVIVIGVADHLIEEIKNEPSAEFVKYKDRVTFIPESSVVISDSPDVIPDLIGDLTFIRSPSIYISIDKDALSLKDAVTNWDQGSLTFEQLKKILVRLSAEHKILGVDICGERALNQDYAEGLDEGTADVMNNVLNKFLFNLLKAI